MHKFKQLFECTNRKAVATIVKCFATLTKSNSVLMIDALVEEERRNVVFIVQDFRQQYQQLLTAAALVFDANFRSRSRTSVEDRSSSSREITFMKSLTLTQREMQSMIFEEKDERFARASQYRNDRKRSNVHAILHYDMMNEKYDLTSHCNVLIDEDKHRYFKKMMYYINHSNIEKTMLLRENLDQTVRLLLQNDFAQVESEVTQLIKNVYNSCSSLFSTLLSRSKQMQLEDDSKSRVTIVQDVNHLQFKIIDCLKSRYCRERLQLSTRSSKNTAVMSRSFKATLRAVYARDYQITSRVFVDLIFH